MIISLIFVSISFISIFYIDKKIETITNTVALKHRIAAELESRTEQSSIIAHDSQIIGNNDSFISNAFVPSDNISEFINAFDNLAAINSISQVYHFETPLPSENQDPFPLSTISYTNSITTNVLSFSNYLKNFERLPYFTKIESLNITSQDKLGWASQATVSFKATLFTKTIQ